MTAKESNLFISDKQAADRYGVHRTTIWRWVKNGEFPPPISLSPGCSRWPIDNVKNWEQNRIDGVQACGQ